MLSITILSSLILQLEPVPAQSAQYPCANLLGIRDLDPRRLEMMPAIEVLSNDDRLQRSPETKFAVKSSYSGSTVKRLEIYKASSAQKLFEIDYTEAAPSRIVAGWTVLSRSMVTLVEQNESLSRTTLRLVDLKAARTLKTAEFEGVREIEVDEALQWAAVYEPGQKRVELFALDLVSLPALESVLVLEEPIGFLRWNPNASHPILAAGAAIQSRPGAQQEQTISVLKLAFDGQRTVLMPAKIAIFRSNELLPSRFGWAPDGSFLRMTEALVVPVEKL